MTRLCLLAVFVVALGVSPAPAQLACDPATLAPGTWCEVPGTRLDTAMMPVDSAVCLQPDVNGNPQPNPCPVKAVPWIAPPQPNAFSSKLTAWNGALWDSLRKRLVIQGGGHAAYFGNEWYTLTMDPLSPDFLKVRRLTNPSPLRVLVDGVLQPASKAYDEPPCLKLLPDGSPVSVHTYDGLEYLPATDEYFHGGSAAFRNCSGRVYHFTFAPSTLTWTQRDAVTSATLSCATDPATSRAYCTRKVGTSGVMTLGEYEPLTATWRNQVNTGAMPPLNDGAPAAVIGSKWLAKGPYNQLPLKVWYADLTNILMANQPVVSALVTGDTTPLLVPQTGGWSANDVINRVVIWVGQPGFTGAVYYLRPEPPWDVVRVDPAPGSPVPPTLGQNGVYDRFLCPRDQDYCVLVNAVNQNAWIYKLPQPLAMDTSPPTTPSKLAFGAGGLTWEASTDNRGVEAYEVTIGGVTTETTATALGLPGLRSATPHTITVRARDAAKNLSAPATLDVTGVTDASADCTLRVGPTRELKTPMAAATSPSLVPGASVCIDPGEYRKEAALAKWTVPDVRIRGYGAHMRAEGEHVDGMGVWLIRTMGVVIEGVECSGAKVPDHNGGCFRLIGGGTLVLRDTHARESENGLLTGNDHRAVVILERTRWTANGSDQGSGAGHCIYVGESTSLTVLGGVFRDCTRGHHIKSRARTTVVRDVTIIDDADSSYLLDFPNGGTVTVQNVTANKGKNSANWNSAITFGYSNDPLSPVWPEQILRILDSSFRWEISPYAGRPYNYVRAYAGQVDIVRSTFDGPASMFNGAAGGSGTGAVLRVTEGNTLLNGAK